IAYDPNSGNFYVSGSNWGIVGWPDGLQAITPSLGVTTTNLLSGINGLGGSEIPFPGSIPAGGDLSPYDFNLLFNGSTWTANGGNWIPLLLGAFQEAHSQCFLRVRLMTMEETCLKSGTNLRAAE